MAEGHLEQVKRILEGIKSPHYSLKLATLHCIRALTRSDVMIKQNVWDSNDVMTEIISILKDKSDDPALCTVSGAIVGNLVIQVKELLNTKGLLERMDHFIEQKEFPELRRVFMKSFKNTFCNLERKEAFENIFNHFPKERIFELTFGKEEDEQIREQGLMVFRNLLSSDKFDKSELIAT